MRELAKTSIAFAGLSVLCAALGMSSVANAQTTTTTTVTTTTSGAPALAPDPASANLAPIQTSPAPPPPLPVYEQPPVPGPGYMWTPGYWARNGWGFYWVPGAWLLAPYTGALWTPGYWGFVNGIYRWNGGYWGPHIGFYGGVNYGFGYVGVGYVGGYWNRGIFQYNRAVTHVDVTRVTNVYVRNVDVHVDNRRISYNGGQGGLAARPDPHELAAAHEQHTPPTRMQMDHMRDSGRDRAQFMGHGASPAVTAMPRPLGPRNDMRNAGPGGAPARAMPAAPAPTVRQGGPGVAGQVRAPHPTPVAPARQANSFENGAAQRAADRQQQFHQAQQARPHQPAAMPRERPARGEGRAPERRVEHVAAREAGHPGSRERGGGER